MKLKRALLTGSLILLFAVSVEAQIAPQPWRRYTVPKGEFSVELPTVPSMTTSKAVRSLNRMRWEIALGVYADGVVYAMYVFENLEGQSLANFIKEQTPRPALDPATERTLLMNGVAGKEYSFKLRQITFTDQFFATKKRLYRFRVGRATADDPRVSQFLSSIVLGPKEEGLELYDGPGIPYQNDTNDQVFLGKEVDQRIILVMKPEPVYTEQARQAGIIGTVVLKVVFTSAGNVSNIRIVSGLPYGLTDNAIAAAKKIKFYPAVKDGKYASMWIQLEYNFNLY